VYITSNFQRADRDTDNYLVTAKVRERLAVSKQVAQKIDTERFNLKNLNVGDVKKQHQVTIRIKFAALENLEDNGDINWEWDNIRQGINISAQNGLSIINHGLMMNFQNLLIKGSRLNYSGCSTQVK
jgi:hypothetical protein